MQLPSLQPSINPKKNLEILEILEILEHELQQSCN